ncbi:MAG: serine/threonine-protein phosphatase [Oscillospiraceae bacterium]|nr:serine/threonine-protein phosphatase [Oscillospiraceae bacterium]
MNNLCAEIGWKSLNHDGEQLCGDHVETIRLEDDSTILVLADGLGSGVKASILSILTSKIISTMIAEGMPLEECVSTIADTLPVCSERNIAYSTFSIIRIVQNSIAEIIQYDNPDVIFIRDGEITEYEKRERLIGDKHIKTSTVRLQENDLFLLMSDGCPYAGPDRQLNRDWTEKDIAEFLQMLSGLGYTAKTLATQVVDECNKKYAFHPKDDTTACVVRIRKRNPVSILFGPPRNRDDNRRMMSLFFSKEGKHIVCGGTTAKIAAEYLGKRVIPSGKSVNPEIPPAMEIEGVDLATEGVVTLSKVSEYAADLLEKNELYAEWAYGRDAASMISRMLFEEATDISFFVGKAVNPVHESDDLPISFNLKMSIVDQLSAALEKMGKRIKVSYF